MGMDIEFLSDGKLSLFMKDYIEESIDLFGEEISTNVSSPEKKGLQNVYESSTRLEKKYADIFHSIPSPFHIKYNTTTKSCCGYCYRIIRRIENIFCLE